MVWCGIGHEQVTCTDGVVWCGIGHEELTCTGAHFHLDCNRTNVLDNTNSIGHLY